MRENSSSTTAWWQWSSWFSGRASLSTTEEEEVYEEGGLRQGRGAAALPPLHYIDGQGKRGRRPNVSPRGRRPSRLDLLRENPRETCPPSQAGGGLPPKPGGGAPPPQVTWERVWGEHHPLVRWFAPSPLAHEALQHLSGLPKHLSVMLAIAWYPWNTFRLQYPSSNISIFTIGPFRNSS